MNDIFPNLGKLAGRTVFITGATRGIGKTIAEKCARDGANIVIAARTVKPHPTLPGTIYSVAKELEQLGGKCLPCEVDISNEEQVTRAVEAAVKQFGGIDILVNNAIALHMATTDQTPMEHFDHTVGVYLRGTFMCSKYCLPHLKKGTNPHILNISPPLTMDKVWFKHHVVYTMAKYGMSMYVLGMAEEFKEYGIAVNALWPKTAVYASSVDMMGLGEAVKNVCRKPDIMADAAYAVFLKESRSFTGNFCIDEDVLKNEGITDFKAYNYVENPQLFPDFFLDGNDYVYGIVEKLAHASSAAAPPSSSSSG